MQSTTNCQSGIKELLDRGLGSIYTGYQAAVQIAGHEVLNIYGGAVSADSGAVKISAKSKFDIASITKLFTTVAILRLVENGLLNLELPVSKYIPEFCGSRAIAPYPDPLNPGKVITPCAEGGEVHIDKVTVKELLTHTSGISTWYPIYQELASSNLDLNSAAFKIALSKPFCAPRGRKIVYSDLGIIVLGELLTRVGGVPMGEAIKAVIADLSIDGEFNPHDKLNIPATEYREDLKRRIQGEVHDENALAMGGIAPHAGLFMSASDLVKFGEALRTGKVLTPKALAEATSKIVTDGAVSRGLGFALATPGATSANGALSPSSYGHYGFTGTSLWIDPERALVAVLLTNRVFYGRSSNTAISDSRKRFHELAISLTSATI